MKIIAFDLGSTLAWASNIDDNYSWAHVKVEGIRSHRLGRFLHHLLTSENWIKAHDVVVFETPFARGRDATRSLWGMAGLLEACTTRHGLPIVDVAVPTIKKFATGSGKGAKVSMIAAAQRMGYKGENEHEADAFCLLKYAEENMERA